MESISKEDLVEWLVPEIEERIEYKVIQSVIDALEERLYPPEGMIRKDFIRSVEEAEKRVREGKAESFKDADELNAFLESLKAE